MLSPKRATRRWWASRQAQAARGPRPDAGLDVRVLPVADDRLAGHPEPGLDEPELSIAVRRLVQVHVVHVDLAPRQIAVELGVQVQQRHLERLKTRDPHAGRRERVHPGDHTHAGIGRVRLAARGHDRVGRLQDGPDHDPHRDRGCGIQGFDDALRVERDLTKRLVAVEVLATGEEPDFVLVQGLHGSLQRSVGVKNAAAAPCGRIVRDEAPGPGKSAGPGVRRVTSQLGTVVASTMGFTTLISVSIVSASYGAGSSTRKVWKPTRR